jgi:hypothetical protein
MAKPVDAINAQLTEIVKTLTTIKNSVIVPTNVTDLVNGIHEISSQTASFQNGFHTLTTLFCFLMLLLVTHFLFSCLFSYRVYRVIRDKGKEEKEALKTSAVVEMEQRQPY